MLELPQQKRILEEIRSPVELTPMLASGSAKATDYVFISGAIIAVLGYVKSVMEPMDFLIGFGAAWNVVDGIAGLLSGKESWDGRELAQIKKRQKA